MFRLITACLLVFSVGFLAGCNKDNKPTSFDNKDNKDKKDHDDHDHDRDKAMVEDAELPGGKKCHAVLEAHMSKKGEHEIEISFESIGKDAKPMTIPEKTKVTGEVQRGDEKHELVFKPSPKDERKTDPDGQCSHFEADAKWMKPDDKLIVKISIEGTPKKIVYIDFNPKKHGHEGD